MAHTPGPWHWGFPDGDDGLPQLEGNVEYPEMNPVLMVAYGCQPKCMPGGCPLLPKKADRDLIAAAPDLFKACKKARQFIENGVEYGYIHLPDKPDPALDTLPQICAAIDKAKEGP